MFWTDEQVFTQFVPEPREDQRAAAVEAVAGCPTQAILVRDEPTGSSGVTPGGS